MQLVHTLVVAALILFLYMTALFLFALKRKDNSIADVAWGTGFIIVAWSTFLLNGSLSPRQWIVNLLVLIWGLRLAIRIHLRNRGKGEDVRYRKWREESGKSFVLRSYLQVFLLQGFILLLNITPVLFINTYAAGDLGILDVSCGSCRPCGGSRRPRPSRPAGGNRASAGGRGRGGWS